MLKDKIVFITGASSGIGHACANYFARAGAKLLLCARRIDVLNHVAIQLKNEHGVDVHAFQLDVRDHASVKQALNALTDQWKKLMFWLTMQDWQQDWIQYSKGNTRDWEEMIDTNVKRFIVCHQKSCRKW